MEQFSIRLCFDDLIKNSIVEKIIIGRLINFIKKNGRIVKIIFYNKNVSKKKCDEFSKSYKSLFSRETIVEFTKKQSNCWFLIKSENDESVCRYSWDGNILDGINHYMDMINHIQKRNQNDNENRNGGFKKIRK